jgi:hypothetical protein
MEINEESESMTEEELVKSIAKKSHHSKEEILAKLRRQHKSKEGVDEDIVHASYNVPRTVWEGFAVKVMREHGPGCKNIVIRQLMEEYISKGMGPEGPPSLPVSQQGGEHTVITKRPIKERYVTGREHYSNLAKERLDDAKIQHDVAELGKN